MKSVFVEHKYLLENTLIEMEEDTQMSISFNRRKGIDVINKGCI